jgi:hypothetical protein
VNPDLVQAISTVIVALGGPALLLSLGRHVWKLWTGRAGRERERNRSIDEEMARRRKALEYASLLRRQLTEAGITPEPWPDGLGSSRRRDRGVADKEKP